MADGHPTPKLYWGICIILCVATFIEWAIFHVESWRTNAAIMIPVLAVLSIIKFVLVCGWYMHLKYDHRWLKLVFVASALLATATFTLLKVFI